MRRDEARRGREQLEQLESPPVLASSCRTNLYDIEMTSQREDGKERERGAHTVANDARHAQREKERESAKVEAH